MSLADTYAWLENTPLAMRIGESWWFPLLESLHVIGVVWVLGTLIMVDLRLLGVAGRRYAVSRMTSELLALTWGAFALAAVTGAGLFITRATHYMENPAFQFKLGLMVIAGINMAALHFGALRSVSRWDTATPIPFSARLAGATSLFLWCGVVLAGRWVGHLN